MCGICGQVNFAGSPVDADVIRRMTATLSHRGPDDEGYYVRPRVGLGMRRLNVIDLMTGHQPMTNEDQTIWLVFNGEIYNHRALRDDLIKQGHRFTSQSDTEVIVHLYEELGPDCVTRLNGMFAFALWDERRQQLFLARDQMGIKPLYYWWQGGQLLFASELKALLAHPAVRATVDPASVADYFRWLYIPGPHTIFAQIKKLLPGTRLLLSAGGMRLERYWQVAFSEPTDRMTAVDACAERLLATLRGAVRRQMQADVPVGVFLSGGVDSSAIVALARECTSGPLRTFAAGFPGMGLYDERPYARRIAAQFDCEHHEVEIRPSAMEALQRVVQMCDEPFGDSSAVPLHYLARFAREHVVVALSGTGGDDLFGGYRRYLISPWLARYRRLPACMRQWLAVAAASLPAHRRTRWGERVLLARRFFAAARNGASDLDAYFHTVSFFDDAMRQSLLPSGATPHALPAWNGTARPGDGLQAYLLADLTTYLPDDLLVKEDRMTMAASLESRVPFLDLDVVRLALEIPSHLKVRGGATKFILRRALRPVLPQETINRPKHGFAVPISEWFRGELSPLFHETVLSPQAAGRPWVDAGAVRDLWERHQRGREDFSQQLWALLVFETWCREYLR